MLALASSAVVIALSSAVLCTNMGFPSSLNYGRGSFERSETMLVKANY
jgi:hypothetical protein